MRIVDEREHDTNTFENLAYGDVFEWNDKMYMKIHENNLRNAVSLEEGVLERFCMNEEVTPVDAWLTVE